MNGAGFNRIVLIDSSATHAEPSEPYLGKLQRRKVPLKGTQAKSELGKEWGMEQSVRWDEGMKRRGVTSGKDGCVPSQWRGGARCNRITGRDRGLEVILRIRKVD
jgi:hypothetical protein